MLDKLFEELFSQGGFTYYYQTTTYTPEEGVKQTVKTNIPSLKQEYKSESFVLFSDMLDNIKRDAAKVLLTVQLQGIDDIPTEDDSGIDNAVNIHTEQESVLAPAPLDNSDTSISRNSLCPCGSGKKYKHCHGKLS